MPFSMGHRGICWGHLGGVKHAVRGTETVQSFSRVHARAPDRRGSRKVDGGVHDPQRQLASLIVGH